MGKSTKQEAESSRFRQDIRSLLRRRVREAIDDLKARGLSAPRVIVADGHKGLAKARAAWPEAEVQRCVQHKWTNLKKHCPVHAQAELKRDWDAFVRADDGLQARAANRAFVDKWSKPVPAVVRSLEEAGWELLTFYSLPKSMWKSLRATNALENLNREFRRRIKTQGSFSTEAASVTLLWGLVAFGQSRLRRIDGYRDINKLLDDKAREAA